MGVAGSGSNHSIQRTIKPPLMPTVRRDGTTGEPVVPAKAPKSKLCDVAERV